MASCFGQNEMSFGKGFQFIRGHQRALDHLQALAGIILSPADGAGQHGLISQGFRQDFRALRVGRKASEQDVLAVINDDLTAFFSLKSRLRHQERL